MSNVRQPKQFETPEQIAVTLAELDAALSDAAGQVSRLSRLRDRLAGEFADLKRQAEALELFTDEDIAALVGDVQPATIARQRRDQNWPHILIGNKPRYTRRHIAAIFEIIAVNKQSAALKQRAA